MQFGVLCMEGKPGHHSLHDRFEIMKVRHCLLYLDIQPTLCLGNENPSFISVFQGDLGQVAWAKMGLRWRKNK